MAGKYCCWGACLVLLVGLLAAAPAQAGPFLGDWGWCWNPDPDCPRGKYAPLHYWLQGAYKVRAWVHPSYLDQHAPGPSPAPPAPIQFETSRCRVTPPTPGIPYVEPAAFYGRSMKSSLVLP